MSEAKFELGQVVMTATVRDTVDGSFVLECLARHVQGDWGEGAYDETKASNDAGLNPDEPERLHSVYNRPEGGELWIITEWDRSVTTALLPSDY